MHELPDCLKRRYQALDDLMNELGEDGGMADDNAEANGEDATNAPGIKLMCRFWNILKEDPYCDLRQAVLQRMDSDSDTQNSAFGPQEVVCYNMAEDKTKDTVNKINTICMKITSDQSRDNSPTRGCGQKKPAAGTPKVGCCDPKKSPSASLRAASEIMPLSKVLCNLQNAAEFDKKCSDKIKALTDVQKQVQTQIQTLEEREKQGIELLKQADCMWTCMEDMYKKKISDSIERQKNLLKEQRNVEGSLSKWRKNKKDLELQTKHLEQCRKEIKEKTNQKNNDLKCINAEITDYKKRVETNNRDIAAAKKSLDGKRNASNNKMSQLAGELKKLQEVVNKEEKLKKIKEDEGKKYIKEARNDLATICTVLLQKKLENEDLRAEINATRGEIELLKAQSDQCKDRCKTKQQNMEDELKKVNEEIANYKLRCIKCHKCVDSADVRRYCTDCPRCQEIRECLYVDGVCIEDPTNACVCMSVKHRFLDNVFENMYTVLERQVKTRLGKALAEQILSCLKKSRNGKLNDDTRRALQDFVLATVKKNLNLTIIGGAVKTRCEMDSDTYKQLMMCLAQITVTKVIPDKVDIGTPARKDPCRRWGGTGECNCPGGPKTCVCSSKAPPPPNDPKPCPQLPEDKEDIGKANVCPHLKTPTDCGPDCANAKIPDAAKDILNSWKPEACGSQPGQCCNFSKNMRAAQCMLGPESLYSLGATSNTKGYTTTIPFTPDMCEMMTLKCGCEPGNCTCEDLRSQPRNEMIQEVMGRYSEVAPIEKIVPGTQSTLNANITQCTGLRERKKSDCPTILEDTEKMEKITKREKKINDNGKKITRFSTIEQELRKSIETVKAKMLEVKDVPLVQAQVMSQAYQERGTDPHVKLDTLNQRRIPLEKVVNNLTNETLPKELFKVAIRNKAGLVNHEYAEITTTSTGAMEMALDERTIEFIDNSTKENPNLFVVLKKTLSGHYVMTFNKDHCVSSENQKILVKRNNLGQITLEVNKNLINTIQPGITHSKDTKNISEMPTLAIELTKRDDFFNNLLNQDSEQLKIPKNKSATYDSHENNGSKSSGIIDDIKKISNLGETIHKGLSNNLTDTHSGNIVNRGQTNDKYSEYLLKVNSDKEVADVTLKRTSSREMHAVVEDSIISQSGNEVTTLKPNEISYKVRVKGVKSLHPDVTCLIKTTVSGNYEFVLDKEFEKQHMKMINDSIRDDNESYVNVSKTESGCYLIDFENNVDNSSGTNINALLVKSHPGNLKLFVKKSAFEAIETEIPTGQSSNVFGELFKKAPLSSRELHREHLAKSKFLDAKSCSDSHVYGKVRIHDQKSSLTDPPAVLKRTTSGQYTVVLNKDSKLSFINNLKKYISKTGENLIPIKKTNDGDIIICLNQDHECKGHYGALKITPSGNIYIFVEENVLREIERNSVEDAAQTTMNKESSSSIHMIGTLVRPRNKGVTTTCNSTPDSSTICDKSKCVCKELVSEMNKWGYSLPEEKARGMGITWYQVVKNTDYSHNTNDPCCLTESSKSSETDSEELSRSPKVKILRCNVDPKSGTRQINNEQCYYVIDTDRVTPRHEHVRSSNELIQIVGPCFHSNWKEETEIKEYDFENCVNDATTNKRSDLSNLDYLELLPPQLPSFLRGKVERN